MVTVASVGRTGARAYYSNTGTVVDIAAPGGDMRSASTDGILSTLNTGSSAPGADSYAYYQGTSMATPHVAGVAALMLAVKPTLTPDQVETLLKQSVKAFPVACSGCGTGIVNAAAAVSAAQAFVAPVATVTTVAEVESNNTLATAQALSGKLLQVNGSILNTSDTDHYRLSIGAGATLTATLSSGSPAAGNVNLVAYTTSGAVLASTSTGLGQADVMTIRNGGTTAAHPGAAGAARHGHHRRQLWLQPEAGAVRPAAGRGLRRGGGYMPLNRCV